MIGISLSPIALSLTAGRADPSSDFPAPTLHKDIAGTKTLGADITFTRASSGTYFDASGVMQTATTDAARFDHNPLIRESLGLLIEESRTNSLFRSGELNVSPWSLFGATSVASSIILPTGASGGYKLTEDSANSAHRITQNTPAASTVNTNPYTLSIFAKASERSSLRLQVYEGTSFVRSTYASFNLSNGTASATTNSAGAGTSSAAIQAVGGGWYRCSLTTTLGGAETRISSQFSLESPYQTVTYAGDGTSGLYIWGAQLEAGSFPTSYIPTVAASATRAADVASMTGTNFSSWYNQTEGCFVVKAKAVAVAPSSAAQSLFYADGGVSTSAIQLNKRANADVSTRFTVTKLGEADSVFANIGVFDTQDRTYACAYKLNDAAASRSGGNVVLDTATGALPTLTRLFIGSFESSSWLNGHISRLTYYPTRLSDSILRGLSS
jgi:hypothetical protein